ncbi:MAG: hypothetical protein IJF90_05870 [Synergistaceae bacterium]|nr:hypothetical protein [Synergistaceae bacterium]
MNTTKVDALQTTMYCGFAILGIIGAFLPVWRERRKPEPSAPTEDKGFTVSGKLSDLIEAVKVLRRSE